MLATLLCNQPYTLPSNGHYDHHMRRRPGERFTTQDEWLRAQEELTKLKAKPAREQKAVTARAVEAVRETKADEAKEAQAFLADYEGALNRLENLEIVLQAYFVLQLRNRQEDDAAAMLMLGVL